MEQHASFLLFASICFVVRDHIIKIEIEIPFHYLAPPPTCWCLSCARTWKSDALYPVLFFFIPWLDVRSGCFVINLWYVKINIQKVGKNGITCDSTIGSPR